jgi:hypothetical protein
MSLSFIRTAGRDADSYDVERDALIAARGVCTALPTICDALLQPANPSMPTTSHSFVLLVRMCVPHSGCRAPGNSVAAITFVAYLTMLHMLNTSMRGFHKSCFASYRDSEQPEQTVKSPRIAGPPPLAAQSAKPAQNG